MVPLACGVEVVEDEMGFAEGGEEPIIGVVGIDFFEAKIPDGGGETVGIRGVAAEEGEGGGVYPGIVFVIFLEGGEVVMVCGFDVIAAFFGTGGETGEVFVDPGENSEGFGIIVAGVDKRFEHTARGNGGTGLGEDARREYDSLHQKVFKLPDHVEVWPGHNYGVKPSSTIGHEKETNPFMLRETFEDFLDLKKNWAEYKRIHGID